MRTSRRVLLAVFCLSLFVWQNSADAQFNRREQVLITLLLGQSNMDGGGHINDLPKWFPLEQPNIDYAWSSSGVDGPDIGPLRLRPASNGAPRWFGPELTFGFYLPSERRERVFLKYARGGTSLHRDWDPVSGRTFDDAIIWIDRQIRKIELQGKIPVLNTIVWVQGAGDANVEQHANEYHINLLQFASTLRILYGDDPFRPRSQFLFNRVHINMDRQFVPELRESQEFADFLIPGTTMIDSDPFRLKSDLIHFHGEGLQEMGFEFAKAYK